MALTTTADLAARLDAQSIELAQFAAAVRTMGQELDGMQAAVRLQEKTLGVLLDVMERRGERQERMERRLDACFSMLETFAKWVEVTNEGDRADGKAVALLAGAVRDQQAVLTRLADQAGWVHCPTCGKCTKCHQVLEGHDG